MAGRKRPSQPCGNLFLVVDDPAKFKDKANLTRARRHVMHDYLDKEEQNPNSRDPRIVGQRSSGKNRNARKRKADEADRRRPPRSRSSSSRSSNSSTQSDNAAYSIPPESTSNDARHPIYENSLAGTASDHSHAQWHPPPFAGPTAPTSITTRYDAFGITPSFSEPSVITAELAWSYSRKFGSADMAAHWIPEMLKAKHAFLSTMCISSSHDDIMQRGDQAPHERLLHGSLERQTARTEVIGLINEAMNDPQMQTADATIVAVLHLLNSEIMGCDGSTMRLHQGGLHQMVRSRGGIDSLGADGQLASMLTITMYMISALRETEPHPDFVKHASQLGIKPANDLSHLPESPVYCRQSGFHTIYETIPQNSPSASLLDDLRSLTNAFVRSQIHGIYQPNNHITTAKAEISALHNKIFSLPPASNIAFATASAHHIYESLRLTALVYAHALHTHIPLSHAAAQLSFSTPSSPAAPTPWPMLIKSHLQQTPLTDLWTHATGTLFWIVLVAGACSNPDSAANTPPRALDSEEEEARKWSAAIAVRCSVVLSWRHRGVVVEMLRRVVGVQEALKPAAPQRESHDEQQQHHGGDQQQQEGEATGRDVAREGSPPSTSASASTTAPATRNYHWALGHEDSVFLVGPRDLSFAQKGMRDFAMDFMGELL